MITEKEVPTVLAKKIPEIKIEFEKNNDFGLLVGR